MDLRTTRLISVIRALSPVQRIRFLIYLKLTILYKLTGWRPIRYTPLTIYGIRYSLEIGMGEWKILEEINIQKHYTSDPYFRPRDDWTCVDVGANIGTVTLEWAKAMSSGTIYAIEPHPATFERFEEHIRMNRSAVTIHPRLLAFSHTDSELELFLAYEGTMAMCPEAAEKKWRGEKIVVPARTLDQFMKDEKIETIDLIKIDVEGYEVDVLKGALDAIKKTKRIVLEYHSPELKQECLARLKAEGFRIKIRNDLIFALRPEEVRTRKTGQGQSQFNPDISRV